MKKFSQKYIYRKKVNMKNQNQIKKVKIKYARNETHLKITMTKSSQRKI